MPAIALTIAPDGWLTDVDLGDPDLRLAHLRRLIGYAAVHPIQLAGDLLMWVADTVDDDFSLNVAATDLVLLAANTPNQTIYGTVLCTGRSIGADITPIPAPWARYLANHQAVQPIDAAGRIP